MPTCCSCWAAASTYAKPATTGRPLRLAPSRSGRTSTLRNLPADSQARSRHPLDVKPLLARLADMAAASQNGDRYRGCWSGVGERMNGIGGVAHQRQFNGRINPYHFIEQLFEQLDETDIVVCGNGLRLRRALSGGPTQERQRMFSNSGSASMGYDLPAAIGATSARWLAAAISIGSSVSPATAVCK